MTGTASEYPDVVGMPGAVTIGYDVSKAMDALAVDRNPDRPQSLYAAAFEELSDGLDACAGGFGCPA
jgi:hypothetical protein